MQGADSFHHLFLSPPSPTPQHIFQTFQSALRCWLVHWLHQLFGMISLHSLRLQWDKRVGNVVHIMGVTIQLWKPKLTPECFLLVPRKAKDDLSTGSKPFFLGKHHHSEELLSGFFWGQTKEASSGRDQRREHSKGVALPQVIWMLLIIRDDSLLFTLHQVLWKMLHLSALTHCFATWA